MKKKLLAGAITLLSVATLLLVQMALKELTSLL